MYSELRFLRKLKDTLNAVINKRYRLSSWIYEATHARLAMIYKVLFLPLDHVAIASLEFAGKMAARGGASACPRGDSVTRSVPHFLA